jgi:hypothetical protein
MISPGDLCIIVKQKPCCGSTGTIGLIVAIIDGPKTAHIICPRCRLISVQEDLYNVSTGDQEHDSSRRPLYVHGYRLKKIPPLEELQDTHQEAHA